MYVAYSRSWQSNHKSDEIYSSLGIVPLTNNFTYIENCIEIKLLKTILATDLLKPISKPHIGSIALWQ